MIFAENKKQPGQGCFISMGRGLISAFVYRMISSSRILFRKVTNV